jgi:protein-tyrosine-phosphatase
MAQSKHKTVLFLCTGNYYRSRFAEILFNSVAAPMGLPWRASSRGLAIERGVNNIGPMSISAIKTSSLAMVLYSKLLKNFSRFDRRLGGLIEFLGASGRVDS